MAALAQPVGASHYPPAWSPHAQPPGLCPIFPAATRPFPVVTPAPHTPIPRRCLPRWHLPPAALSAQGGYQGVGHVVMQTIQKEGPLAFWSGFSANFLRLGSWNM